jgi:hypothetical protein
MRPREAGRARGRIGSRGGRLCSARAAACGPGCSRLVPRRGELLGLDHPQWHTFSCMRGAGGGRCAVARAQGEKGRLGWSGSAGRTRKRGGSLAAGGPDGSAFSVALM